MLAHCNNSLQVNISSTLTQYLDSKPVTHSDTVSWFLACHPLWHSILIPSLSPTLTHYLDSKPVTHSDTVSWFQACHPLWHSILIPSQTVFVLSPSFCVLGGGATNTNFIVFGLIRSGLEPAIHHTRGKHANHYTTDAVLAHWNSLIYIQRTRGKRNNSIM
jgi:hypothetical protein